MTGTLTHPRLTARPIVIMVAAFVTAAAVVLVLALSVLSSGGSGGALNPCLCVREALDAR